MHSCRDMTGGWSDGGRHGGTTGTWTVELAMSGCREGADGRSTEVCNPALPHGVVGVNGEHMCGTVCCSHVVLELAVSLDHRHKGFVAH
jgi:hypothetical protein